MHVCPQFTYFPIIILKTALSILAVSSTIIGHFPPNSNKQGVKFFAAYIATSLPVIVEPVKHIKSKGSFVTAFATSIFPSIHL